MVLNMVQMMVILRLVLHDLQLILVVEGQLI